MKLTKKQIERLNEIEQDAIDCYLDKTDFDISEWIADEYKKEWRELKWNDYGECPTCGETIKNECNCE